MNLNNIRYFFPKLQNRLKMARKLYWKYHNVEKVAMKGYEPFESASLFKLRLQSMLGKYDHDLLRGIKEEDKYIILFTANQALRHEFELLGSGPVILDPIDWHADFKSGARWQKKWYCDISPIKGADIKVPWELSRCQHLLWLGEAYLLTGEKKYAQEVIDEINWWIDDNPLMYSVNWKCSMDVAFRAVNWLFALNMVANFEGIDNDVLEKISSSLWQHGFFIRNNLEKAIPFSNNHYTSDLVGLLYMGVFFLNSSKGRKWKDYALKELCLEVKKQVLSTGVHYERSISYHRMMTEMLSYPIYMLQRVGEKIPHDIYDSISRMYDYVSTYTKPNGLAPLIGDNDDGRFLPCCKREFRYHNYLNSEQSVENCIVSTGMKPLFCSVDTGTRFYNDAGVAIIRKNNDYIYINNGGYSKKTRDSQKLLGTHTHNDLLSFELVLNGQDIIVDSGTYLYTSSKKDRDSFRSTKKHNTIVVDGEEQNGLVKTFMMERNVCNRSIVKNDDGIIEGHYETIFGAMSHTRKFHITDEGLEILDTIEKRGAGHECKMYFHLAEKNEAELRDGYAILINGVQILFGGNPIKVELEKDTLSHSYGVLVENSVLIVTYMFNDNIEIKTVIRK